jgi:hypothetical protein
MKNSLNEKTKKRKKSGEKRASSTEKKLVENFVALQKVMTNLAVNFDNLSNRIQKLLDLFDISAKALAEKDFGVEKEIKSEKEINSKLDMLIEHNKVFARGLTLLHEKNTGERVETAESKPPQYVPQSPQPLPLPQIQKRMETDGYQRSISSKP